ncbi:MAG: creatininase family protein [Gaiellaceae bacterium]
MSEQLLMEELTSREIAEAVAGGKRIAIVPLGSIEAHGPQLPINTDSLLSRHVAHMVAERLGNALVAHTMPLGYLPRMTFPGSISVPVEVVLEVLRSYCTALQRDGFRTVVLLPMHAEHFQTLALYAPDLGQAFPELTIVANVDVGGFIAMRNDIGERHGIGPDEAGWHAGAAETSEMLAFDPARVRTEAFRRGYIGPSGFGRILPETLRDGWRVLDPEGVMGDPEQSTAEFGQEILDRLADFIAEHVRAAHSEA